jgi:hypothetical protein
VALPEEHSGNIRRMLTEVKLRERAISQAASRI